MLQIYDDHGEVSLSLTIQGSPWGFRVAWMERFGGATFSHSEQSFPSREEAQTFVRDFLWGRPGEGPHQAPSVVAGDLPCPHQQVDTPS